MEIIDSSDRGLAYGDGLFETIAYVKKDLHNWKLHWQRLTRGGRQLLITMPEETDILSQIHSKLQDYYNTHNCSVTTENAIVKIILTRGIGGRGYAFPEPQNSTVIISVHNWPQRPDQDYCNGINIGVCTIRLAQQPALAGLKHLNRLEQVLARNELSGSTCQEGLMLAYSEQRSLFDSLVIEGISSNLFFVRNGQLLTPEIDTCGILGTLRLAVMEQARQLGMDILEGHYPLKYLQDASEVFFTNSVFGIVPVAAVHVNKDVHWHYHQRLMTTQLATSINKDLQRPYQFDNV